MSQGLTTFGIGAIIGIGILKGGRNIQINVIGKIAIGWLLTPIIAGLFAFFALFFAAVFCDFFLFNLPILLRLL